MNLKDKMTSTKQKNPPLTATWLASSSYARVMIVVFVRTSKFARHWVQRQRSVIVHITSRLDVTGMTKWTNSERSSRLAIIFKKLLQIQSCTRTVQSILICSLCVKVRTGHGQVTLTTRFRITRVITGRENEREHQHKSSRHQFIILYQYLPIRIVPIHTLRQKLFPLIETHRVLQNIRKYSWNPH